MHIDLTGHWTCKMYEDWNDFQIEQQVDSMERVLLLLQSRWFLFVVALRAASLYYVLSDSWSTILFRSEVFLGIVMHALALSGAARLRRAVKRHPHTVGIISQMTWCLMFVASCLVSALSREDDLFQHRVFLCMNSFQVLLHFCFGYLPFWAHCLLYCPAMLTTWMIFHWIVAYWNARVIVSGIISQILVPLIIAVCLERLHWQQFLSTRQLNQERNKTG